MDFQEVYSLRVQKVLLYQLWADSRKSDQRAGTSQDSNAIYNLHKNAKEYEEVSIGSADEGAGSLSSSKGLFSKIHGSSKLCCI